jgi:SulP family sulfate permease
MANRQGEDDQLECSFSSLSSVLNRLPEVHIKHRGLLVSYEPFGEEASEVRLPFSPGLTLPYGTSNVQQNGGDAKPRHDGNQETIELTPNRRQVHMEQYDYAQRRMHRRLIVDLRGLHAPPLHDSVDDIDGKARGQAKAGDLSSLQIPDTDHKVDEVQPLIPAVNGAHKVVKDHATVPRKHETTANYGVQNQHDEFETHPRKKTKDVGLWKEKKCNRKCQSLLAGLHQVPAIAVVTSLWFMMALPFGVSFFPIGWTSDDDDPPQEEGVNGVRGPFPLPGKEALGIRMCLFATIIGQLVMTYTSSFANPITFQLVENVPFYHALAYTVIRDLGYGMDALSTLVFLFGLSSILVGAMFYLLGTFKLGRVVYFFPSHLLAGWIGGIGIYIVVTSVAVTNDKDFTLDSVGLQSFVDNIHLFGPVIFFEAGLRILMWAFQDSKGRPKFAILAPVYFFMIVPIFYLALYFLGVDTETAREAGYFFPNPGLAVSCRSGRGLSCSPRGFPGNIIDDQVLDMFHIVDFRRISWTTVAKSIGTLVSMASFALIHVPINIPAFAVSLNVDTDMNAELVAHGYSNILSGVFGGLQTIMTYSFSVLYMKSGGQGRCSLLAVAGVGVMLFIFGPQLSVYIPVCMAGTLLLHVGLDLFLEGIFDSWGSYDRLEYAGILFIALVMTTSGMTAALLAGIIAALSTYAVQSITNMEPILRIMSASTLRSSSSWTRSFAANEILNGDATGRARVLIVQLQGHLFFGNVATMTDTIKSALNTKKGCMDEPFIVILDFTIVVGMDSSAAHAIAKLNRMMHMHFNVEVTMFVSGIQRNSFPCDYALAEALSEDDENASVGLSDIEAEATLSPGLARRGGLYSTTGTKSAERSLRTFPKYHVCKSLDEALEIAEDVLIARDNPRLHQSEKIRQRHPLELSESELTLDEERILAKLYLENLAGSSLMAQNDIKMCVEEIMAFCSREVFTQHQSIWKQGDESDSMKLLVCGTLLARLDATDISEVIHQGATIGELGLVQGGRRLCTVHCSSPRAVTYTLDKLSWEQLVQQNPRSARVIDHIAIKYLSERVQHVSNRIFETRCLPI